MTEHDKITSITERVKTPDYSLPLWLYGEEGDAQIRVEQGCYEGTVILTEVNTRERERVMLPRNIFRPLAKVLLELAKQEEHE